MRKLRKAVAFLLVFCMVLGMATGVSGTEAQAANGTKPKNGTTSNQPFSSETGGSTNFRIPAMVTLSNGTIVAAADARWNDTQDGGGNDTIVSYSKDKGATWNYTFANYLGDNGNEHNDGSTAFIDPALATDGSTVYMLVDLFPAGYCLSNGATNTVKSGDAFTSEGYLRLSVDNGESYGYYLKDGKICNSTDGAVVDGYTVDSYFNITGNNVDTNLFYADSPYQVVPTTYLYLTSSSNGGATWNAPTLVNVKGTDENFYGVGPGAGIVISNGEHKGRIVFPCYDGKNTSVIYSDNNGAKWTRGASLSDSSTEAAVTEVNGTLYLFTRKSGGGYYVSTDGGATWGSKQTVKDLSYYNDCQISAVTYSKTVNGKPAILLSAPSGNRTAGRIFTLLVNSDKSLTLNNTYSVNSKAYAYSSLAELSDGSVGLLYESNTAAITYTNLAIANVVASGAEIGGGTNGGGTNGSSNDENSNDNATVTTITVPVGGTVTVTDKSGQYGNGTPLDNTYASATTKNVSVAGSSTKVLDSAASLPTSQNGTVTGVISDGSGNYLVLSNGTLSNTKDINQATEFTVTKNNSYSGS